MLQELNVNFEKAIRMLSLYMPVSNETTRKPVLFHGIRVGTYLYNHGYSSEVVLAGLLHDILEDTDVIDEELRNEFGEEVLILVRASTKNDTVPGPEKTEELIKRCVSHGESALIVKTADILDSFAWYEGQNNTNEIAYCMKNAESIIRNKPENFTDPIFTELQSWYKKFVV